MSNAFLENEPSYEEGDIRNPRVQQERIFSQDKNILDAVSAFAIRVRACPMDPHHPECVPTAVLVGGFVRDALAGKHPKDADIEVYGVSTQRLEALLDQLYGHRVNKVGRTFGIFKVALGEGVDLDISIPRRESKMGSGHRGFDVQGDPFMSPKEAARRRDFTFNALFADPLTGTCTDFFGGMDDLKTHTLRVTDEERFQDDPLRVYRAMQFVARLHLHVEETSFRLMKRMVERGDLHELTKDRITEEWAKLLLKADAPSRGFDLAEKLGIFEWYHPELAFKDSWEHFLHTIDGSVQRMQASEHPFTANERLQVLLSIFFLHTEAPATMAEEFFAKTSFSKKDVCAHVASLLKEQGEPKRIFSAWEAGELTEKQTANEIRQVIRRIYPISPFALLAVGQAQDDQHRNDPTHLFFTHLAQHPEWLHPKNALLVRGEDLKVLGIVPGKAMGEMLRRIEEARDRGEVETREEALEWISSRLSRSL